MLPSSQSRWISVALFFIRDFCVQLLQGFDGTTARLAHRFNAADGVYPIVCIQVDQIRKAPAMMNLKLRIVKNKADEYAGCIVLTDQKTIAFKIDCISDLITAMKTE